MCGWAAGVSWGRRGSNCRPPETHRAAFQTCFARVGNRDQVLRFSGVKFRSTAFSLSYQLSRPGRCACPSAPIGEAWLRGKPPWRAGLPGGGEAPGGPGPGSRGAGCWGAAAELDDTAVCRRVRSPSSEAAAGNSRSPTHIHYTLSFTAFFLLLALFCHHLPPWSQGRPKLPWRR